jgi:hypothetical protein
MAAAPRIIARDWASGVVTGVLPFSKFSYTDTMCAAGTWTGELDPYDPAAALLVPHRTYVYVLLEDGTIDFAGMLGALDWSAQGDGIDTLTASGYSLWGYFWRRLIPFTRTFGQVDQFQIAQTLVDDAQTIAPLPVGSIGVGYSWNPPGGSAVLRDRSYDLRDAKILGEAVEQLADVDNGFEFRVVAGWTHPAGGAQPRIVHTLELWYPRLGVDQPYVWRDGTAIRVHDYSDDFNAYASSAFVTGAVVGNGTYGPSQTVAVAVSGEPLYEIAVNATDVSDTPTLTGKGNQAVQTSEQFLIQVELIDQDTWPYGTWQIGDTIRLISDRGSLHLHGDVYWRITGRQVDIDDIGVLTVSINFTDSLRRSRPVTRAAKTLARQRAAQASAVSTLQRHP